MRKAVLTCRICKKKFGSVGSSTCSEECFKKSVEKLKTWEILREQRGQKKRERAKPKNPLELTGKKQKQLNGLLKKQSKEWNADRARVIQKLQGTFVGKRKRGKAKKPYEPNLFYDSREWQELRYKAIKQYGRICMCCGAVEGEMHVDHIKPRSKFPGLELVFENLQILCRACNLGKSNKDDTDFRK